MPTAQSSINKPLPPMKKRILIGIQILILFWFQFDHHLDSCNSCNQRIIVMLLLPVVFLFKGFYVNPLCPFLCCVLSMCTIPLHFSLVVKIDSSITCSGKLPPQTYAFIESWVYILDLCHPTQTLLKKASSKASSKNADGPKKAYCHLQRRHVKGQAINAIGGMIPRHYWSVTYYRRH